MAFPSKLGISIAATSGFILLFGVLIHLLAFSDWKFNSSLDLQHGWEACIESRPNRSTECKWVPVDLPDIALRARTKGGPLEIRYRTEFLAPASCFDENQYGCTFFVGGTYQGAEAILNGKSLGLHFSKSDSLPAAFMLPRWLLARDGTKNELVLSVRTISAGRSYPAISQGPVGIYSYAQSVFFYAAIVGERIVLPLLSAAICLSFALVALFWMLSKNSSPNILRDYIIYCILAAAYMFNATRFPRELLNHAQGFSLNFALRFLADLGLFNLVASYYFLSGNFIKALRRSYVGLVALFSLFVILSTFDEHAGYLLSANRLGIGLPGLREGSLLYGLACSFMPFILFPSFIGLFQSFRQVKQESEGQALLGLFLILAPMQVSDALTFLGVIRSNHEIYYLRLYTPFIALSFGYCIWMRWISRERLNEATLKVGEVARSAAHDLRSPLAALKVILNSLPTLEVDQNLMLTQAIRRIEEVSCDLLRCYKGVTKESPLIEASVDSLLEEAILLKKASCGDSSSIEFQFNHVGSSAKGLFCRANKVQLARAFENLLANAIESTISVQKPVIRVEISHSESHAVINISDNGCGMTDSELRRLNARDFGRTSKQSGHGIGLAFAWEVLQRHAGGLIFKKNACEGTTVQVHLPLFIR